MAQKVQESQQATQIEYTPLEKLLGQEKLTIKDMILLRNIDKTETNLNFSVDQRTQFYRTGFQLVFGTVTLYSILAVYSVRLYINHFSKKFELETQTLLQPLNNEERYKLSSQRISQLELMVSRIQRLRFPFFVFGGMIGFNHGLNLALAALKANSGQYVSDDMTKNFSFKKIEMNQQQK